MSKSKLSFALGLTASLTVLYFSDRTLRHAEKLDQVVLQGQTGLSWLDEMLARRAAYQGEVQKLEDALAAAKSVEKRIEANYAVVKFETDHGRSESRRAKKALNAITSEGGARPETIEAWHGLLTFALAARAPQKEREDLLKAYVAAVAKLLPGPEQLTRLLESWRLASENRLDSLALITLQRIQREFPINQEALPAYKALAKIYAARQNKDQLAAVEMSVKETESLLSKQGEERGLVAEFEKHFTDKNMEEAEKVLFQMTPGLIPSIDCWAFQQRLTSYYESQSRFSDAERLLLSTPYATNSAWLTTNQFSALLTTSAMLLSEKGAHDASRTTLARAPDLPALKKWRSHLETRLLWSEAATNFPVETALSVASSPASGSSAEAGSDPLPTVPWIPLGPANPSTNLPQTRWKTTHDNEHLFVLFDCIEPEPDKMVARNDQPQSNVWEDDCVEIFIAPTKTDAFFSQIVVNSKGTLCDLRYKRNKTMTPCGYAPDLNWASGAAITALKTPTGWRVGINLPLKKVEIQSSDRACFFNVRRQRYVTGKLELFSWSENGLQAYDPSTLGLLFLK